MSIDRNTNRPAGRAWPLFLSATAMVAGWMLLSVPQSSLAASPASAEAVLAGYERAAAWQSSEQDQMFRNLEVQPRWITGHDSFWYKRQTSKGFDYVLVDAVKAAKSPAFSHDKLASTLAKATGKKVDAAKLPLKGLVLTLTPDVATFSAFGKSWRYDIRKNELSETAVAASNPTWRVSPDGQWALYAKDNNLWVKDLHSTGPAKADRQLTDDGLPFYAYGANPDATGRPAIQPEAVWSLDSKKILTAQTDDRQVLEMPMIEFVPADGSVRPRAWSRRAPLPGDEHVAEFRMVAIDVASGKQVTAHYPRLPATRMNDTPLGGNRAWWGADGTLAYFVDIDRGEKAVRVVEFNTVTGKTRTVFQEQSGTYVELSSNVYMPASIVPLPATNELVWYSERSGWAHLYLYDLATGRMKNAITQGNWLVRDVLGVDEQARQIYLTIGGREAGRNPYYREVVRVGLDDGKVTTLSSGDEDHLVYFPGDFGLMVLSFQGEDISTISGVSPSKRYVVETTTRIDMLPVTWLRDNNGKTVLEVERATAPGLPKGWSWPEPVMLKAADGQTDIAGAVFRPSDFSPDRSYPVIDHIYGGPQVSNVPEGVPGQAFLTATTLAELGFIVVVIDGRGTTERSRAFHEASYGAVETASDAEDHMAGIRQLAKRYPYMDVERVGITGFSGGGYATAIAMLRFPEFFKVGVAGAGNFDQRLFWHSWGERYQGLLDGDNYLQQASPTHAAHLRGKLLFIHGLMDHGVHAGGLFQLMQALMDENKLFDLVLMPKAGHELPGYAMVRQWDYFVEHLAGNQPPVGFKAKSGSDLMQEKMLAEAAAAAATAAESQKTE